MGEQVTEAEEWYRRLASSNQVKELTLLTSNYLSLGQFELARATLKLLHDSSPDNAIRYLTRLVTQNVPSAWLQSESVPSSSHLVWMCIQELKDLAAKSNHQLGPEIDSAASKAEFGILLKAVCDIGNGSAASKTAEYELNQYYSSLEKASLSTPTSPEGALLALSDQTHVYLRHVYETDFALAHYLCEHLFSVQAIFRETTRALYDTKVDVISELLDRKTPGDTKEACELLRYLNFSKDCMPTRIDELFQKFMRLYMPAPKSLQQLTATAPIAEETVNQWSQFQRMVYNNLLAAARADKSNHALVHFMKLERALIKADADSSPNMAPPFFILRSATQGTPSVPIMNVFWSQYQSYISVTKKHFLEYVLMKGIELLAARQWSDAAMLLTPFAKLKPALLLMTWDKFSTDIDAREQLLSMLWNENASVVSIDPDIASKAKQLNYQVKLARWCAQKIEPNPAPFLSLLEAKTTQTKNSDSVKDIPNIASELLRRHSILYVLHGHLNQIPADDLVGLIKLNPDTSARGLQIIARELTLVHAYYALKTVCDLVHESLTTTSSEDEISRCMAKVGNHIASIEDYTAQMTLLESIFWLIFARAPAWSSRTSFGAILLSASTPPVLKGSKGEDVANDGFVCDGSFVLQLIVTLQALLSKIPQSPEIHQRMLSLSARLAEGEWRARFIFERKYLLGTSQDVKSVSVSKERQFMRFMVATPQSLIIRCIREKDFEGARQVISFFDLSKSQYNDMVSLAEKVHQLRSQLPSSSSPTGIDINDAMFSLSDMEKFLIAADISICISKSKSECQSYLEQSRTLLKRFSGQSTRLTDVSASLLNYLTRLETLLVGDLSEWDVKDSDPLSTRLLISDNLPTNAAALSEFIRLRNLLSSAADTLRGAMSSTGANIVDIEAKLKSVVESLEVTGPSSSSSDESGPTRGERFLYTFTKQLLFLGNSLREDPNGIKTKNFFDLLNRRPNSLLSELVLQHRNLKRAEAIADALDIDLLGVILHALIPGTLARGLEDNKSPSQQSRVQYDSPTPLLPSINPSQDFMSPPGHAGLALTPTIMTAFEGDRRPWLSSELIEFMRKKSPIVAILACVLRAPTDRIDPALLENALTASSRAFPALHNWVLQKAKELALFDSIHLQKRFDKVATVTSNPSILKSSSGAGATSRRRADTSFGDLSNPSTPTKKLTRSAFASPSKEGSASIFGDREDPLALGSTLLFEPLHSSGGRSQPKNDNSAPTTPSDKHSSTSNRPRTNSSARRRLPMSQITTSSTSMPAIVDNSFPDSSDDDVDEPRSPIRASSSLVNVRNDQSSGQIEEGDIDLTSTPSSFSPSSFEAYRHQLQTASGAVSTSVHNSSVSFARGDKLGSSLAVDIEPRIASSQGSAIGASAKSITSLMQQQGSEQSGSSRPTPVIQSGENAVHQHILALFDGVLTERTVDAVDSRHILERIVRSESMQSEHQLYRHLVQTLVQSDRLERALTMAENCLPTGAPDDLILALLGKLESGNADPAQLSESWQLILRLRDKVIATPKAVFHHYRSWDLARAIDMFFMCEQHLSKKLKSPASDQSSAESTQLKESLSKVQETHRRLVTYRDAFNKFQQSGTNQADDDVPLSPSSKSRALTSHSRTIVLDTLASQRWQKLDQLCEQDLAGVINALTDSDHYDVARKIADHFRATSLKVKIEERYLLHLLTSETDTRTVRERLLSLEKLEAIRVAESLLESVTTNEHRLFLIQFLMERKSDDGGMPGALANGTGSMGSLSTKELGVKILLRLPVDLQAVYQNHINKPLLIVESLFMSEQTAVLASVLKDIPQIRDDNIVLTYALKALDTNRLTTPVTMTFESVELPRSSSNSSMPPPSPMKRSTSTVSLSSSSQPTIPSVLTSTASISLFASGDRSVEEIREQHTFASAPNHQLATAFLDLCSSARVAASKCIEISDSLSNRLQSFRDRLEVVRIIQQLLVYAKLRLMKEFDSAIDVEESPRSPREDAIPPLSPRGPFTSALSSSTNLPFAGSSSFSGALQSASTPALVSLCDTLLSRIELLQQLLFSAPDLFQSQSLSLSVFADPTKIRQLRDKLLEQDRLDTALLVAAKCNIESEPVWAAKALQMLQSGRYQEAKQLFKYCLVSSRDDDDPPPPMVTMSRAAVGISVAPNRTPADNGPLLQKILRVLESGTPLDANELRRHYTDIVGRVTTQPTFVKKLANYSESGVDSMKLFQSLGKKIAPSATGRRKHTLDSLRYMQCIYYLQRYGTSEDLIQFWLRHGLIEDAMRHVISNHLDAKFFNIIVMHAISHNLLARIKEWVVKQETASPKSTHEYILATCKHLNSAEMFKLLLEFQLMMKDAVRAGLTCVKIFNRIPPQDFTNRLNYLNMAKKYFQQGLEDGTQQDAPLPTAVSTSSAAAPVAPPSSPLATKSDISKYVRTANLQIRVTTFFQQNVKSIPPPETLPSNISLFQNAQRRAILAEVLLTLHNFDLAFAIVQEYRLPTQKIYQSALVAMALKQQGKKIDELLKMVKPWLSETEWDEIILAVVRVYMETHNDASNADNFASKLRSEQNKIESLILMRKLKQAYLAAVKVNSVELVERIQEEAKRLDMRREYELCEKFLQSRVQN